MCIDLPACLDVSTYIGSERGERYKGNNTFSVVPQAV